MARNRRWLWPAALVAASAVSSAAFACVTPFAALAVAAVYALSARAAFVTVACVWFANQVTGFAVLGYPWAADTALWGFAIGAAALLAAAAARATMQFLTGQSTAIALAAALLASFGAYEAALFIATFMLGGQEAFAPSIVGRPCLIFPTSNGAR